MTTVARLLVALAMVLVAPHLAQAKSPEIYTGLLSSTPIGGYDPLAYFTDAKPVAGKNGITHSWKGVTWRFASGKSRDLFKAGLGPTRRSMARPRSHGDVSMVIRAVPTRT